MTPTADGSAGHRGGGERVSDGPLDAPTFSVLMDRIGGFEPRTAVAVGVSGGADSLALTLLLDGWVRSRGGTLLALTVDHRLRPQSTDEAEQVAAWLGSRGIRHAVLPWLGTKPGAGIQNAARLARLGLLAARCREEGILHLALAHHREDQAETVLLRLSRGSGPDGLAGMAPVRWDGDVRVFRPLLPIARRRLAATCGAAGQAWIDDPSNRNPAFARGRLRAVGPALAAEGLTADTLFQTGVRCAEARRSLDRQTAALLARAVEIRPEGWAIIDRETVAAAPSELARRALGRVLRVVGGCGHPPRDASLDHLVRALAETREPARTPDARTLGGCVVGSWRGRLVVAREPAAAADRCALTPGATVFWDNRFTISLSADAGAAVTVARLDAHGWRAARGIDPGLHRRHLPPAVRWTLPGLWRDGHVVGCPVSDVGGCAASAQFTPPEPLAGPAFPVVSGRPGII